jgi:hypothetical protein
MFAASLLQDSKVLLVNLTTKANKVIDLALKTPLTWVYPIDDKLLTTDEDKNLSIFKLNIENFEFHQLNQIKLTKRLTHGWVDSGKIYYWDKYGDVNSVVMDDVINFVENSQELDDQADEDVMEPEEVQRLKRPDVDLITHESGNFSTLTAFRLLELEDNVKVVALSDEYYKIRFFDFPNLHKLRTNIAFRKRYVTSLQYFNGFLYLIFDDNKMFRIKNTELYSSDHNLDNIQPVLYDSESSSFFKGKFEFLNNWENGLTLLSGTERIWRFDVVESEDGSVSIENGKEVLDSGNDHLLVELETGGDWSAGFSNQGICALMDTTEYVVKSIHDYN